MFALGARAFSRSAPVVVIVPRKRSTRMARRRIPRRRPAAAVVVAASTPRRLEPFRGCDDLAITDCLTALEGRLRFLAQRVNEPRAADG